MEFQYGNGKENPVDKMWFYRKYSPDEAVHIKSNQVKPSPHSYLNYCYIFFQESSMLPKVFIEVELRMYCTSESPEDIETVDR